jgi:hypothetical protein
MFLCVESSIGWCDFFLEPREKCANPTPAALIAQLVEHLICNQGVPGSSPGGGTKNTQ